jgi:hypothetical protein
MNSTSSDREDFSRRKFLTGVTRGLLASAVVATNAGAVMPSPAQDTVPVDDEQLKRNLKLSPLYASSEQSADAPPLPYAPQHRVGIAVVGLGHLSLSQILPAFGAAKRVRLAGLVSGDPKMEAIYESAQTGKPVRLMAAAPSALDRFRGSPPQS